jgi:tRNA-splicing ligase RtcB
MTQFPIWGREGIDQPSIDQMANAMKLPVAVAGALMPDAHLGYGLPIGGVLALDNAVCPYAVGVDIACRMKLSVFEFEPETLEKFSYWFAQVLEEDTCFGVGGEYKGDNSHDVISKLRGVGLPPIAQNVEKAERQLGTSGSGNHFVEWGILTVQATDLMPREDGDDAPQSHWANRFLDLPAGQYLALLSHSGSRGTGAAVCNYYSKLAKAQQPRYGDLGWFDLDSDLGQEYFAAMNLMGDYAAANHDVIHREIALSLGRDPIFQVENHHNFAWKEVHQGREVIVHRKGATPAGKGVLGIIPGSMGTPAYVVRGKGNPESLCSASHGAGRVMSRTQAKKTFNYRDEIAKLKAQGVTVLSAGADEVVGVYKNIDQVMAAQSDLVDIVARFDPKIVKMCGDNSRAED